ncbi:DMT family transporter [Bdellovibrio sp. NC01]|uniref:DMT family transporter n=1 Tax=Bdellovibrio sp. NC01 TaxID=2220073 RepID=UPI00115773D8|nr:DMT family transporter [Bdellovibrio sp. NC01]QDK39371.1 EamA/RhaT family transporter [Bdellovibrio sp. NC01]
MRSNNKTLNYNYVVYWFLGLLWGTNFLFMKMAVQVIQPAQVALLRIIFGMVPIIAFGLINKSLKLEHLRHSRHFLAMGLLAVVVPYLGFIKGTQLLASGAAGAISGIIPLMTALFAALFLPTDRMNSKKFIGLLLGFIGVAFIAHLDRLFNYSAYDAAYGAGYMLLGSLGYAAAMIYARKFITPLNLSSLALACYQIIAAAIVLSLVVPMRGAEIILQHPQAFLATSVGLGFLGTGLAFVLYYRIIEKLGAVTASSVFYIPPVMALIIGALIANEEIGPAQYAGALMILVGVSLTRNGDTK